MDEEFGQYLRVTGADDKDLALAAAAAAWPSFYDDDVPALTVESEGWYRCQPCVCGLEHRYDIWQTEPNARGSTYTYLIGLG